jgi:hypothetical protein
MRARSSARPTKLVICAHEAELGSDLGHAADGAHMAPVLSLASAFWKWQLFAVRA